MFGRGFCPWLFVPLLLWGVAEPRSAMAQGCREATIQEPSPFMGNHDEILRLDDGSIWKVQFEYEYLYEYYPRVVVCAGQGKLMIGQKVLNVVELSSGRRASPKSGLTAIPGQIVVVAARSGCRSYFLADGPMGIYLLEWYGGYSPSVGDVLLGDLGGCGFKDVFYPSLGSKGRVYVDDYMLSRSRAIEKYAEKCS